jgi:hypothetical protein
MAMVDVRNVTKVYRRDAEELVVLNGLSLQVEVLASRRPPVEMVVSKPSAQAH